MSGFNSIDTVREVRKLTGWGLRDAHNFVMEHRERSLEEVAKGKAEEGESGVPFIGLGDKVRDILKEYHAALDNREHGDVAADRVVKKLQTLLNMPWVQGASKE